MLAPSKGVLLPPAAIAVFETKTSRAMATIKAFMANLLGHDLTFS
jgi:hypothetical protein